MRKFCTAALCMVLLSTSSAAFAQNEPLATDQTKGLPSPNEVGRQQGTLPSPQDTAQQQRQQVAQILFQEIDNLIPGKFAEDSPQKKAMEQAVALFQDDKPKEALAIFDQQAAADPQFPPNELLVAGLQYAMNNTERGQRMLEGAAIKHPQYPGVFLAFARLAINQGRITDGLALLEKSSRLLKQGEKFTAVEQKHFQSIILDGRIDVAMAQEKYPSARKLSQQLKAIDETNNKVLLTMAELEFRDAKVNASLGYLEQLKQRVPATRTPELVLAAWFQQQGDELATQKWAKAAADKYPNNPVVQVEFANHSVARQDFPTAKSAIKRAETKLGGEQPSTINLKARIAFSEGAFGLAESYYKKLFELQPSSFDAANMYALSLIESDDEAKRKLARQLAERNYRQAPKNSITQAAMGWILFKTGDTEQARQLLSTAAAGTPAPEVRYFVASLLHASGESERARLFLEPAVQRDGFYLYRTSATKLLDRIAGEK